MRRLGGPSKSSSSYSRSGSSGLVQVRRNARAPRIVLSVVQNLNRTPPTSLLKLCEPCRVRNYRTMLFQSSTLLAEHRARAATGETGLAVQTLLATSTAHVGDVVQVALILSAFIDPVLRPGPMNTPASDLQVTGKSQSSQSAT